MGREENPDARPREGQHGNPSMVPLAQIGARLRDGVTAWRDVRLSDVLFGHRDTTILALIALIGLAAGIAVLRVAFGRRPGRAQVGLPALLSWARSSSLPFLRHGALLLALAGLPFFMLALADPYTQLQQQQLTFPGRRIALMLDASASMVAPFQAARLRGTDVNQAAFFTTVAAAETFIRQRMKGRYRDLIALVEFGDESYVVTPFTSDYDNILLSLSLVGDWTEFMRFPSQGTTIGIAVEQSVALFRTFEFLNASGNLMVIISDGQDSQAIVEGRSVTDILADARRAKIPVYFIRVSYNKGLGRVLPDEIWKPAVEATGGRFYAAADESTVLKAIDEIDRRSAGTIAIKRYSTGQPQFAPFALVAAMLWTAALALKLTVPYFQKFP
jgi:Ca-activated chloride channel homolog